jgi:hypothetical protein
MGEFDLIANMFLGQLIELFLGALNSFAKQ